jgi:hypothetical protein
VYIGSLPPWRSIVSTTSHSRPSLWWGSFSEFILGVLFRDGAEGDSADIPDRKTARPCET